MKFVAFRDFFTEDSIKSYLLGKSVGIYGGRITTKSGNIVETNIIVVEQNPDNPEQLQYLVLKQKPYDLTNISYIFEVETKITFDSERNPQYNPYNYLAKILITPDEKSLAHEYQIAQRLPYLQMRLINSANTVCFNTHERDGKSSTETTSVAQVSQILIMRNLHNIKFAAFHTFSVDFVKRYFLNMEAGIYGGYINNGTDDAPNIEKTNIIVVEQNPDNPGQLQYLVLKQEPYDATNISYIFEVETKITFDSEGNPQYSPYNYLAKILITPDEMSLAHEYRIAQKLPYLHMRLINSKNTAHFSIHNKDNKTSKKTTSIAQVSQMLIMLNLRDKKTGFRDFLDNINEQRVKATAGYGFFDMIKVSLGFESLPLANPFLWSKWTAFRLSYCHEKLKITHGDLKPENCLYNTEKKEVYFIDVATGEDLTTTDNLKSTVFTPICFPPEAYAEEYPNRPPAFDLHCLGIMFLSWWNGIALESTLQEPLRDFHNNLISLKESMENNEAENFKKATKQIVDALKKSHANIRIPISIGSEIKRALAAIEPLQNSVSDNDLSNQYDVIKCKLLAVITSVTTAMIDTCQAPDEVKTIIKSLVNKDPSKRMSAKDVYLKMDELAAIYFEQNIDDPKLGREFSV